MPKRDHILVGLDIGTTKICAIVAEVLEEGPLNIIGVGSSPSRGLRKGVVVNIDSTVESIKHAVAEAEEMAGVEIGSVIAGVAGGHIRGIRRIEDGLYHRPLLARADEVRAGAHAQRGVDGVDEDGLARAGFAREDVEARPEFQVQPFNQRKVADVKFLEHWRCSAE